MGKNSPPTVTDSKPTKGPLPAEAPPVRRYALAAVVVSLLAVVIFFLVLPGHTTKATTPTSTTEPTRVSEPAPKVTPTPAPKEVRLPAAIAAMPAEPGETPPTMDRASFNQRKAAMTEAALKDVVTWLNYPLWSQPLTENMQYKPRAPFHSEHGGPGGAFPTLEFFTDKTEYAPGEPVQVFAIAHDEKGKTFFDGITAKTMGQHKPRPEILVEPSESGDKLYKATLQIPADVGRKERGEWGLSVDCVIAGEHRIGHTQFYIMATDAVVTGPFSVALEDGSLSVSVGIKASVASRQHLKGELWGPHGEPIAYAWVRNDQTPQGESVMKLVFYGKTLRDSGSDGPYTVKNLLLTTFDTDNERIVNPPVDPHLKTPPFRRDQFTDQPINQGNEVLEEKKKILEGELATAKANGFDPANYKGPPATKANKGAPPPQ